MVFFFQGVYFIRVIYSDFHPINKIFQTLGYMILKQPTSLLVLVRLFPKQIFLREVFDWLIWRGGTIS